MTKKELVDQICRLDEGYTPVSLKRFNKKNLEELLKDLNDKKFIEEKLRDETRIARRIHDGNAVLCGIALGSIVVLSILIIV